MFGKRAAAQTRRTTWPVGHSVGRALVGTLLACWHWNLELGVAAAPPPGFGLALDPWLNRADAARPPRWAPGWVAPLLTGALGALLARALVRREGPQTWPSIRACFLLWLASAAIGTGVLTGHSALATPPGGCWNALLTGGAAAISGLFGAAVQIGFVPVFPMFVAVLFGTLVAQISRLFE